MRLDCNVSRRQFLAVAGLGSLACAFGVAAQELARPQLVDVGPAFLDSAYRERVKIAQEAYIWGYSLVQMGEYWKIFSAFDQPVNRILVTRDYTVENGYAPNMEILYGFIYIDLSKEPQILSVPDTAGRYYSFQFLDAYGNIIAYVSKRTTATKAGAYILVGPQWQGNIPQTLNRISSPHNQVLCIIRTFVSGTDDLKAANAIQNRYAFGPLSRWPQGLIPSETLATRIEVQLEPMLRFQSFGPQYFDLLGDRLTHYPPSAEDSSSLEQFAKIGIGAGHHPSETKDLKMLQALRDGIRLGEDQIESSDFSTTVNGWSVIYGVGPVIKNPILRAFTNRFGAGFHIAQEGLYFMRMTGPDGKPLSGANRYRLRFAAGDFPPVNAFWTLSLMKPDSLSVDNPIHRYSIAGHTKGLVFDPDGSLDIAIQHEQPPSGPANWLPAPPDGFRLTLRMYEPKDSAVNGTYKPPQIQIA
jgi:hypothetical protein